MKYIEQFFIDKSKWPRGEWDNEPDKIQWVDLATGLPCLLVRRGPPRDNPDDCLGHLCGYVGVPEGHPYFQVAEDDVDVSVHGGLTYAAFCQEEDRDHGICHIAEPGEPDRVWWLGFDCAHFNDLVPGIQRFLKGEGETRNDYQIYRTVAFVQAECAELARQLKEAARAHQS